MKLKLQDIKKGQEFFEFTGGKNLRIVALENARHVHDHRVGYVCKCLFKFAGSEEKVELFEPAGSELQLFSEQQKY